MSHCEDDINFANRLLVGLRQNNVPCWHYKADLLGGQDWKSQIDEAIKVHDKLILVCSRRSVYRENVIREIERAIDQERKTGQQKL
ncbi:toll/interleukin-1 receptor domain-containing protein, partial [Salmonella enterica]